MKQLLHKGFFLMLAVLFSTSLQAQDLWDGTTVASSFHGGTGTPSDPYQIRTGAQLKYFEQQVNAGNSFSGKTVRLLNNIDLGKNPLEIKSTFAGTFDGNGCFLEQIFRQYAIFQSVTGTIKNLGIRSGVYRDDRYPYYGQIYLAQNLESGGLIENCYNKLSKGCDGYGPYIIDYHPFLVGSNSGIIRNCYAKGNYNIYDSGGVWGGYLVGMLVETNNETGVIENCAASTYDNGLNARGQQQPLATTNKGTITDGTNTTESYFAAPSICTVEFVDLLHGKSFAQRNITCGQPIGSLPTAHENWTLTQWRRYGKAVTETTTVDENWTLFAFWEQTIQKQPTASDMSVMVDDEDYAQFQWYRFDVDDDWQYGDWTSTNHESSTTSSVEIKFYAKANQHLRFSYKVSSEKDFDEFKAYLNGKCILTTSGEVSDDFDYLIEESGDYTLRLQYHKDDSDSSGSDQVKVTNITVPGGNGVALDCTQSTLSPTVLKNGNKYFCKISFSNTGASLLSDTVQYVSSHSVIDFADTNVKALCVANWDTDGDGELSEAEAAAVTNLGEVFKGNNDIVSFTELAYFTGLNSINDEAFWKCKNLANIVIPDNVTKIGTWAFLDCYKLPALSLSSAVTEIGWAAFSGCYGMTTIKIADENPKFDSRDNCNAIIETATNKLVRGCQNTIIPASVTSIDGNAFEGCETLKAISIPESVVSIGDCAFAGCKQLGSANIPSGVKAIGGSLFRYCEKLASINIPEGLTKIGIFAFDGCSSLTSITLPSSVKTIEAMAFYCSNLTSVTVEMPTPIALTDGNDFGNHTNATLYVPAGSKAAYEAADYWKDFKEIVEMESESIPVISINSVKARRGKTAAISIDLTNESEDLTAFQFDFTLPDGITLAKNDKGKYQVSKTSRFTDDNQSLNVSLVEGNTYRVLCFSMENGEISGYSGAVLDAMLQVSKEIAVGQYQGKIENIVFTKTDGTVQKQSNTTFDIEIKNVIPGDANDDEEVNVGDIVEIVSYIMGTPSSRFVIEAADCNGDGEINVGDIVAVVSIIMSGDVSNISSAARNTQKASERLWLKENDNNELSLCMVNNSGYLAVQMDVCLERGQTLKAVKLNRALADSHHVICQETTSGNYRIVIYSMDNEVFAHVGDDLLTLQVSGGNVEVENILFVTSEKNIVTMPAISHISTGITSTMEQQSASIYDLQGNKLTGKQMQKGVYIINGKKRVVK